MATIGVCQDCGNTWEMNKILKIAIIAVAWAVYILIVIAGMQP